MKFFALSLMTLLAASVSFAHAPPSPISLKVTSFQRVGDLKSNLGELCGQVTVTDPVVLPTHGNLIPISIKVDGGTAYAASYTVLPDRNGNFCGLVVSFAGEADVEAWLPGGSDEFLAKAQATRHGSR